MRLGYIKKLGLNSIYSTFVFFALSYFVIISPFYPELSKFSVRIILPVLFMVQILISKNVEKYILILVGLYLYSAISITYCLSDGPYIETIRKFTAVVLFSYLISSVVRRNPKFVNSLYLIYILLYFYSLYYSIYTGITSINASYERFDNDIFGTNVLGYYLFMATFGLWYFSIALESSRSKKINVTILFASYSIGLYFLILGATRGGIMIALITIFLFIFSKYAIQKSTRIKILYFLFFGIIISMASFIIFQKLEGLLIFERFSSVVLNYEDEIRWSLLIDSMNVGFNHFLFGVGAGNVSLFLNGAFSHSSFTEIFANHGIFGLILLGWMFVEFNKQIKKLNRCDDPISYQYRFYFLSFIIVFTLYNLFYVMYLHPIIMGFFYLMRSHLENISRVSHNSD